MLWTEEERQICKEHERREDGTIGCEECPLRIKEHERMCKAIAHYNMSTGQWEWDWN